MFAHYRMMKGIEWRWFDHTAQVMLDFYMRFIGRQNNTR